MHSLKELVVKLNDRNIQRQRESGFTIYAILVLVAYLIYFLIDETPQVLAHPNRIDYVIVSTILGNIAFCLLFFLILTFGRRASLTKIFPNQEFLSIDSDFLPYFSLLIFQTILNFYSFANSFSHSYIYILFGLLIGLNFISPIAIKVYQWWKNRGKLFKVPEFTYLNSQKTKAIQVGATIYGILLSVAIAFLVAIEVVNLTNQELSKAIKYDLHFFGAFFLWILVMRLHESRNFNDGLEELEKEIYLKNLPDEEIKKRLEEEYFGQDFGSWVIERKKSISQYFDSLINELTNINNAIPTILDSKVELFVRQELYNSLFAKRQDLVSRLGLFNKEFEKQINHLRLFSSIENEEWQYFFDLQGHYQNEIQKISLIDTKLFEFFNAVQSGKTPQQYLA